MQYLITFFSRPEAAGDVICGMFVGPVVRNKYVKFHDTSLNDSREIPPEAVGGGIFDGFPNTSDRKLMMTSNPMCRQCGSGCLREIWGFYRSNGFQDIRGADFVSNERTNRTKAINCEK